MLSPRVRPVRRTRVRRRRPLGAAGARAPGAPHHHDVSRHRRRRGGRHGDAHRRLRARPADGFALCRRAPAPARLGPARGRSVRAGGGARHPDDGARPPDEPARAVRRGAVSRGRPLRDRASASCPVLRAPRLRAHGYGEALRRRERGARRRLPPRSHERAGRPRVARRLRPALRRRRGASGHPDEDDGRTAAGGADAGGVRAIFRRAARAGRRVIPGASGVAIFSLGPAAGKSRRCREGGDNRARLCQAVRQEGGSAVVVADHVRALTGLAQNVALLLSLTLLYSVIRPYWRGAPAAVQALAPGALFGLIAVVGMHAPIVVGPGVIADGRMIPVVLAGPFGGPGAAIVAAVIAGLYRAMLGGAGAAAGVGTILTAGLLGIWLGRRRRRELGLVGFVVLGLVLDAAALLWSLVLPDALARQVLGAALVPVGLFLPVGTLFLGALLSHEERRHSEREHLTLTQFSVDHAAEAMFWLDADGRFVSANPAALALTRARRDELLGLALADVDLDTDAAAWPALWSAVRAGGRVTGERRYRARDGAVIDVDVSYDFMAYRGREWVSAVARDIGDRKRAEAERGRHLVRERRLREQAEAASTLKDQFLATLSHELRTPLTPIVAYARLLRGGRLDDAATTRALDVIERNGQAQSRLVDDLIDVSSIVLGTLRIEPRPVDLAGVVRGAVERLRDDATARSLTLGLDTDGPLVVAGDAIRLQQVIDHLVNNALKFTPAGGRVTVRLRRVRNEAELTVRDTGAGIEPAFLPHVFDRFRQADGSMTRAYEGLGVGLAIVRALVELHDGRVSA